MRVKCPSCGAVGTDVKPYHRDHDDPPLPRSTVKATEEYGFEPYGNLGGRPVRKCLNCGAGIRVTLLPPRFRRLSDEEWAEFKGRFETWRAEDRARLHDSLAEQEEVEELTERVRRHLLEMEAEAGEPRMYPEWVLRQFVKGVVITEVAPARISAMEGAFDDPAPEKPRYEHVLDRVLLEEGLTSIAEEVLAAVTISSDDWEQMSKEERRALMERRSDDS